MANPTITINATGITVSGPLIAGEPVAVTASGLSLPEGAALTLALSSRAPNALLASCVLAESEETPGTWTGTLETASRQMAVYFATAAADDTRPAVLELVETTTRDSLALLVTSIRNSALIPSSSPCAVAPVYLPIPGPAGPQVDPSDSAPQMDGAASAGTSDEYARGDHQHPTDTSRMAATATGVDIIVQPTGQWGGAPIATFAGIITERVNAKQDTITDLATIRSGAAAGATAVQQDNIAPQWSASATYPPDSCVFRDGVLFFSVKQTGPGWNENDWIVPPNGVVQRINGSIDSLAVAVNQVSGALSNKQDIISDLATIRSGAAAGATAVQPADLSAYRTASAQDTIDGAQDEAIAAKYTKPATGIPAGDLATGVIPSVPSASDATPQMDGAGAAGTATTFARGDHQHPTDTTRQAIIQDLATIRSGAARGATAVQLEDMDEVLYFDPSNDIIMRVGKNRQSVTRIYLTEGIYGAGYAVNLADFNTGVRYSFASPIPSVSGTSATVTCEDRAINDFTVATGITSLTITPPVALSSIRARDFFCRVTLTDSSLPTVTLPAGQTVDIGQSEINGMTQGVNLLMFTEIASGHWLASRRSAS